MEVYHCTVFWVVVLRLQRIQAGYSHLNQLAQPPRRAGEWKGRQVEVAFVLWAFPLFLLSSYGLILFYLMYCVAKSYLKICS